MRRIMLSLLGLFLGSVLLNVVLLVRLREHSPSDADPNRSIRRSEASPGNDVRLAEVQAELANARGEVERLQREQTVLSRNPDSSPVDRIALFRESLNKLAGKVSLKRGEGGADFQRAVEESELRTELNRLQSDRLRDPALYGRCLRTLYENILARMDPPCSASQETAIRLRLKEMVARFDAVHDEMAADRLASSLQAESELFVGLASGLDEVQQRSLQRDHLNWMLHNTAIGGYNGIDPTGAAVAARWGEVLDLTPQQNREAIRAGQSYIIALERIQREAVPAGSSIWTIIETRPWFEMRARAAAAQSEALKSLLPSLTPAQQERMRTMPVREYLLSYPTPPPGPDDDNK